MRAAHAARGYLVEQEPYQDVQRNLRDEINTPPLERISAPPVHLLQKSSGRIVEEQCASSKKTPVLGFRVANFRHIVQTIQKAAIKEKWSTVSDCFKAYQRPAR
jgi:hypothetical protein